MWSRVLLLFWTFHTKVTESSKVFDWGTDNVDSKKYCTKPDSNGCPDGSHVMCMYYHPKQTSGPNCYNFQNIKMVPELSELVLAMVNEIRGKVAMGKETVGGGKTPVPRGYGIFKVKWDDTLAKYAQVKANMCMLKFDLCRATKTFKNPGQLLSVVRFSLDWIPVENKQNLIFNKTNTPTLNAMKYAVRQVIASMYGQKEQVSLSDIKVYPDYQKLKNKQGERYLQLINAKLTHIGCGISAYTDYLQNTNIFSNKNLIYNTIQVVCNLSSNPEKGKPVFDINRKSPNELCPNNKDRDICLKAYNSKCGCPAYIGEDDRCLCTDPITYPYVAPPAPCGKDENCKPAVVLLPIFTVDDAPQNKLTRRIGESTGPLSDHEDGPKHAVVVSSGELYHNEIDGTVPQPRRNNLAYSPKQNLDTNPPLLSSQETYNTHQSFIMQSLEPPPLTQNKSPHIMLDHEDAGHGVYETHNNVNYRSNVKRRFDKKESIFARAPKFELHNTGDRSFMHDSKSILRNLKKDVIPRRDFSNAKMALDKYLNEQRYQDVMNHDIHNTPYEYHNENVISDAYNKAVVTIKPRFRNFATKSSAHDYPNKTISQTKFLDTNRSTKSKFPYSDFQQNENVVHEDEEHQAESNINEDLDKDKKFMNLLNTLEQEVKNIDLKADEKKIFNEKMKKIYSSVVHTNSHSTDFKNYDTDDFAFNSDSTDIPTKLMLKKTIHEVEDVVKRLKSKAAKNLYTRPVQRDQSALRPVIDKNIDLEFRNTYSDAEDYENKKYYNNFKLNHKGSQVIEKENEVKTLPQNVHYNKMKNGEYEPPFRKKNRIIHDNLRSSEYNTFKDNKYFGEEFNKRNRNYNRESHKARYEDEIINDYENKPRSFITRKEYVDYADEPLSSERRKYYQEKLDNIERSNGHLSYNKPLSNHMDASQRYGKQRVPSIRVNESNGFRRYYLPNRALSRPLHGY